MNSLNQTLQKWRTSLYLDVPGVAAFLFKKATYNQKPNYRARFELEVTQAEAESIATTSQRLDEQSERLVAYKWMSKDAFFREIATPPKCGMPCRDKAGCVKNLCVCEDNLCRPFVQKTNPVVS